MSSLTLFELTCHRFFSEKIRYAIGSERSLEFTQHRKVQMSDEQHGIITSFSGAKFLVDLVACTCTRGHYQVNNIPCGHAVAYIVKLQKEPRPEIFGLPTAG